MRCQRGTKSDHYSHKTLKKTSKALEILLHWFSPTKRIKAPIPRQTKPPTIKNSQRPLCINPSTHQHTTSLGSHANTDSKPNLLLALVGIGSSARHHLAQLEFLGELAAQLAQLGDEGFGDADDGFFGGDGAVGLDAELDGGEEGVGDWGGVVSWVMSAV